jgi:putative membrane protein
MDRKRIWVATLAAMMLPTVLAAQVDPTSAASSNTPGMSQSTGQPGTAGPPSSQASNQPQSLRDSLGAPGETGQHMLDQQFVRDATEGGIADVKLSSLAVEKGGPDVKVLAQKLLDDHTAMNKDMATVADAIGVMLPKKLNKDGQKEYDKLNGLSDKDFDTEYVTYMVKTHFDDLHNFHTEASVAADPELAAIVVKQMGMMHQHIGLILNLAKQDAIALPLRPPRPGTATASK